MRFDASRRVVLRGLCGAPLLWAGAWFVGEGRANAVIAKVPPRSWRAFELVKEAAGITGKVRVEQAHILAWKIEEDERPWRLERALVCGRFRVEGREGVRHVLAEMVRTPMRDKPQWGVYMIKCPRVVHRYFPARAPNNLSIEHFVNDFGFSTRPLEGYRLLGGGVNVRAWRAVTGEEPLDI